MIQLSTVQTIGTTTTTLDFLTGVVPVRNCRPLCVWDAFFTSRRSSSLSFNRMAEVVPGFVFVFVFAFEFEFESSHPGGIPRRVRPPAGNVLVAIAAVLSATEVRGVGDGRYRIHVPGRVWTPRNLSTMSIWWGGRHDVPLMYSQRT